MTHPKDHEADILHRPPTPVPGAPGFIPREVEDTEGLNLPEEVDDIDPDLPPEPSHDTNP